MEITFACGIVESNIGVPAMAMRHHLANCDNATCQQELPKEIEEMKNFVMPW